MGITIHSSGMINDIGDIPSLVDEVKRIAKGHDWKYEIIDDSFEEPPNAVLLADSGKPGINIDGSLGLKGVVLVVDPKAEPLCILFDRSGVLTDILSQISWLHGDLPAERSSACKTQFGTIDSHICIVDLLETLKERYIADLFVEDEGSYWTTRDRELLSEKRGVLDHYIRHTGDVIRNTKISPDSADDSASVASHIEKALLDAEAKKGPIH